ncbi:MAG: hypothetical protein VB021_03165 [Oscillospiraceae bacterium]|nr:hypothetical protein [Oscillospiraceae bacterium]
MAYLLELEQGERRSIIGVVEKEKDAKKFLAGIPFVKRTRSAGYYRIRFADMPDLYDASYGNWHYAFSRFSWRPKENGGEIDLYMSEVSALDADCPAPRSVAGQTVVDGYSYANEDVAQAVQKREQLYGEARDFYRKKGLETSRSGLGSEDGEYVLAAGHFAFHLDPDTVAARESADSFEDFLKANAPETAR